MCSVYLLLIPLSLTRVVYCEPSHIYMRTTIQVHTHTHTTTLTHSHTHTHTHTQIDTNSPAQKHTNSIQLV